MQRRARASRNQTRTVERKPMHARDLPERPLAPAKTSWDGLAEGDPPNLNRSLCSRTLGLTLSRQVDLTISYEILSLSACADIVSSLRRTDCSIEDKYNSAGALCTAGQSVLVQSNFMRLIRSR